MKANIKLQIDNIKYQISSRDGIVRAEDRLFERWITTSLLAEAHAMNADEVSDRLLAFAVRIGKVVDELPDTRLGRHVAGQLVRCGTSPPSNYEEARAAESRADFIHKLGICLKELRESRFWLRLIIKAELLPDARMADLLEECTQLCNIIGQSIVTAKGKKANRTGRPST